MFRDPSAEDDEEEAAVDDNDDGKSEGFTMGPLVGLPPVDSLVDCPS